MWYSSRTALIQPPPAAVIMIRQVPVFTLWNSWCKTATTGWFQICTLSMVFKYTRKFSVLSHNNSWNSFTRGRRKSVCFGTYLCTSCIWKSDMQRADLRSDRIHRWIPLLDRATRVGRKLVYFLSLIQEKTINTWECQQGYSSHQGPKRTNSFLPHSHQHERWSSSEFL